MNPLFVVKNNKTRFMYDIIGDIHGHATELRQLLSKLGYRESANGFQHRDRKAVFCGDFVDRGPEIPESVALVRSMVESGAAVAVIGNHEMNALAFNTSDSTRPGKFLRPHTDKNVRQHAATLNQFRDADLQDALRWFATLPTSIDLGNMRVVHACWSDADHQVIQAGQSEYGSFTEEFLRHATAVGDPLFDAIECVLKGPELPLPDGVTVKDKEGHVRRRIRIRWYEPPNDHTWATYSLPAKPELPKVSVPADSPARPYPADAPPVFVGHFWLSGADARPLTDNIACLDYSVARHGHLAAYRFDGEPTLSAEKFVMVPAESSGEVR